MNYIAYYRVSTTKQEQSGLSLEAQQRAVLEYIRHNGNKLIAEFTETESGKKDKRPELGKAIWMANQNDATLVIAKLDRLARNLHFVTTMMTNKVKFVAADMPEANELTIHIISAMAEYEHKLIVERVKASYASRRARDPNAKFGTNNLTEEGRLQGIKTIQKNARKDPDVLKAWYFIKDKKGEGLSYREIAKLLNEGNYTTRRSGRPFFAQQVLNIWKRFNKE